ncbi:hypothetical protein OF820_03255 [Oceanotoga sp. DSM 15011]|uniref:hypothetical protein n=1 Tax=Oceanotoga sp. DSM 15011 TaxID=2984951 RepID=UPI0021F417B7|nr:hypothetical protein [Oceanotoga sp. DSM 15011]UYP00709.1 hypothetical protein OF820_03255 [Oceanotoga sp. DSM 15011]
MIYIIFIILALMTSSWDRWLGDYIFYSFPIMMVYIQFSDLKDEIKYIVPFIYTLFYFQFRYDVGFVAIIFYILYVFLNWIFKNKELSFITVTIYSGIFTAFLGYLSYSIISSIITMILIIMLYFLNLRLIINGK